MCGLVLVVVSMAEPNCRYPSPIPGRAEHKSLNTYETMQLCSGSMMGEVEDPIRLYQVLSKFQLKPRSMRDYHPTSGMSNCCQHIFKLMYLVGCIGSGK